MGLAPVTTEGVTAMTDETGTPAPETKDRAGEDHDAERRAALQRLTGLLAAAPAAALLFDPKRAAAYGDGSLQ